MVTYFFLSNLVNISLPKTLTALSSDHLPVQASVLDTLQIKDPVVKKDFKNANWVNFERLVEYNINIGTRLETNNDIDRSLEELTEAMVSAEATTIPTIQFNSSNIAIDHTTLAIITFRNATRRLFYRKRTTTFSTCLKKLNKIIQSRCEELKNLNFSHMVENLKSSSKPFWKVTKILRKKPKPIPPLTTHDNSVLINPLEKGNAIGQHIYSSHTLTAINPSPYERQVRSSIQKIERSIPTNIPVLSYIQVSNTIKSLKNFKAPGKDGRRLMNTYSAKALDKN